MTLLLVFLLGVSVGSFFNVLIDRLPSGENPLSGRSHCDYCKKNLSWFDLIPVFSFVILFGRCRFCKKKLSFYYPVVELITGLLFVLTLLKFVDFSLILFILFNICFLIVTFFTDLKYGLILDKLLYPAIFLCFIFDVLFTGIFQNFLFSAIFSFIFFLVIFLATFKKGMGFGDVKLAFYMGLFLGFPKVLVAFYIAFLTGAIVSIILILCRKKRFLGDTIAFGPFLVLGVFLSLFWGDIAVKMIASFL